MHDGDSSGYPIGVGHCSASIRRQTALREDWLKRNPKVRLDTSLTLHDLGKSAYTGEHRKNADRHALAAFLKLVDAGKIPRGSYLLIENLDRLSRVDEVPAGTRLLALALANHRRMDWRDQWSRSTAT